MGDASRPLAGLRVLEIAAIGPVTHGAMLLADLGADVVRVARPAGQDRGGFADRVDDTLRGRRQVTVDLKTDSGRQQVQELATHADVLIEGFRPGVAERLGIGPDDLRAVNPGLVYARMTGWGQDGPLAQRAGHDINYISVTGALHAIGPGPDGRPVVPLNLVGDFGGGSLYLALGVLAAVHERQRTGIGRTLDVAMVDGVASLEQPLLSMAAQGSWSEQRRSNLVDGGTPFYDTYVCSDGRHVAVGALEPQFYAELIRGLGLEDVVDLRAQYDRSTWGELRERLAAAFRGRTRDDWATHFAPTDACVTPVLTFAEARTHPHLVARGTMDPGAAETRSTPAPRYDRDAERTTPAPVVLVEVDQVHRDWSRSARSGGAGLGS